MSFATQNHHRLRTWRRYALPGIRALRGYSPFPMSVTLHITLACNLRCEMCCQQHNEALQENQIQFMKPEDFRAIVTNLEQSFPIRPRLHITGGEPSIHRNLAPMVRFAQERGFTCSITSNGARIEEAAEELVALGLHSITLSLDGVEEVHNRIRGRDDSYARVVAAAKAVRGARDRAGSRQPMITINGVVTRHNYHRLVDLVGLTQAVGGDHLTIQQLVYVEGTAFADHRIEDIDLLVAQLKAAQQLGRDRDLPVQLYPDVPLDSLGHYYLQSVADDPLKCVDPWVLASVMPNGDVLFCFSPIAGNALVTPFDRIWRGDVLKEHRRTIAQAMRRRNGLPSEFCQRCCYRLYD